MALGTSSTLTQEFVDLLSAEMLLAPDPQFVFATLAEAARAGSLDVPGIVGRQGGAAAEKAMSEAMGTIDRMSKFGAGFAKVVMDPTQPGKVILIDRPVYTGGNFDEASRTLAETATPSATPIAPTLQQVSLTVKRYAGPHDGANVAPIGISDFLKRRSKHDLINYIGTLLRRDRNAFADSVIIEKLLTSTNQTIGNGGAGGGTTGGMTTAGNKLKESDLATIKRKLLERNVPTFPDGTYGLVIGPRHEEDLRADSAFREIVRYASTQGPMWSGYLGQYGGFTVCISNNIPTAAVGAAGAVTGYQAFAFGPQAMGWGVGMQAEARRNNADQYGLQDLFIWVADEAWGLLNAAFVEKIVTS
jgi:N4-gp56 family major capsid protein